MKKFACFIISAFIIVSCTLQAQSKLPGKWNDNMVLTISIGPGMLPDSYLTTFSNNGCKTIHKNGGKIVGEDPIHLTDKDLDSLAYFLKKKKFDLVKSVPRKGIVYDMRTTDVTLTINDKTYGFSVGATADITGKRQSDYRAIMDYIHKLISTKTSYPE